MRLACFHFTSVGFILSRLITCLSYPSAPHAALFVHSVLPLLAVGSPEGSDATRKTREAEPIESHPYGRSPHSSFVPLVTQFLFHLSNRTAFHGSPLVAYSLPYPFSQVNFFHLPQAGYLIPRLAVTEVKVT